MNIIGFHYWKEVKEQAGLKFITLKVENGIVKRIFEPNPNKDIRHISIAIFQKCFDFQIPLILEKFIKET